MNLQDFITKTGFIVLCTSGSEEKELTGFYVGDLLSRVMANAKKGNGWITIHSHMNVVAVALMAEISCIILAEGQKMEENVVQKAIEEGVAVFASDLTAYEICCKVKEVMEG